MQIHKLENFTKGWFIGDFKPSILSSKDFEVAIKNYQAGDREAKHVHKIAREFTAVTSGKFLMNGQTLLAGDIMEILPGEAAEFECLESGTTVVVKTPSIMNDKYLV